MLVLSPVVRTLTALLPWRGIDYCGLYYSTPIENGRLTLLLWCLQVREAPITLLGLSVGEALQRLLRSWKVLMCLVSRAGQLIYKPWVCWGARVAPVTSWGMNAWHHRNSEEWKVLVAKSRSEKHSSLQLWLHRTGSTWLPIVWIVGSELCGPRSAVGLSRIAHCQLLDNGCFPFPALRG